MLTLTLPVDKIPTIIVICITVLSSSIRAGDVPEKWEAYFGYGSNGLLQLEIHCGDAIWAGLEASQKKEFMSLAGQFSSALGEAANLAWHPPQNPTGETGVRYLNARAAITQRSALDTETQSRILETLSQLETMAGTFKPAFAHGYTLSFIDPTENPAAAMWADELFKYVDSNSKDINFAAIPKNEWTGIGSLVKVSGCEGERAIGSMCQIPPECKEYLTQREGKAYKVEDLEIWTSPEPFNDNSFQKITAFAYMPSSETLKWYPPTHRYTESIMLQRKSTWGVETTLLACEILEGGQRGKLMAWEKVVAKDHADMCETATFTVPFHGQAEKTQVFCKHEFKAAKAPITA